MKIKKFCKVCNKVFYVIPAKKNAKYCSRPCKFRGTTKAYKKPCEVCGEPFLTGASGLANRFCSVICSGKKQREESRKRLARLNCAFCNEEFIVPQCRKNSAKCCSKGCYFALIHKDGRSYRRRRKDRFLSPEHRLIVEEAIGRKLRKNEVVHHIDENRLNNSVDNLFIFKNCSDHTRWHFFIRKYDIDKYAVKSNVHN